MKQIEYERLVHEMLTILDSGDGSSFTEAMTVLGTVCSLVLADEGREGRLTPTELFNGFLKLLRIRLELDAGWAFVEQAPSSPETEMYQARTVNGGTMPMKIIYEKH